MPTIKTNAGNARKGITMKDKIYNGLLQSAPFAQLSTGDYGHADLNTHIQLLSAYARKLADTFDYPSALARLTEEYFIEYLVLSAGLEVESPVKSALSKAIISADKEDQSILKDFLLSGDHSLANLRYCVNELHGLFRISTTTRYRWILKYIV